MAVRRNGWLLAIAVIALGASPESTAQEAELVKDINSGMSSEGSDPSEFLTIDGTTFFAAATDQSGRELWKTDGTEAGTVLVADIYAGSGDSWPANLTDVGGTLFFRAGDAINGRELWRSDGTAAGTVLVSDILPGSDGSFPEELTDVAGTLFFTAFDDQANGGELWKSDGTAAGTVLVKDIAPGGGWSQPQFLTAVDGALFFSAMDEEAIGVELWTSDGTEMGTVLVKDINPGSASSRPGGLTAMGGVLFFAAVDEPSGWELWKSDGTEAGTLMIKDINPGSTDSSPRGLFASDGTLYFAAADELSGHELWRSDGTEAGTVLVKDIRPGAEGSEIDEFVESDGVLFFRADDGIHGSELWRSDGTAAGTVLVEDIGPGAVSAWPSGLTNVDGMLFFSAYNGIGGGLWRSDGTSPGTLRVYVGCAGPEELAKADSTLLFVADDCIHEDELWRSDGSVSGTVMVANIASDASGSDPEELTDVAGTLFFRAADDVIGEELWKSDGTVAGTMLVRDIFPGADSSRPKELTDVDGMLFFTAYDGVEGTKLWRSDGTASGTVVVKSIYVGGAGNPPLEWLVDGEGTLFFTASDDVNGRELWKSDGTEAGTSIVKDIRTGRDGSDPRELVNVGGTLFFEAFNDVYGSELWKSDGTSAGTVLVRDACPGPCGLQPTQLTDVNGTLFFSTYNDDDFEAPGLWKSDGTEAGTVLVSSSWRDVPTHLTNVSGTLFFTAGDFTRELWKCDGTTAGTTMVRDILPGWWGSTPEHLTAVGDTLFFVADDGASGRELWKSDGTEGGTVLVKDIYPGTLGSNPRYLVNLDGSLMFDAADPSGGREIWMSDGTTAGTVRAADIVAGSPESAPRHLTEGGDILYFSANDGMAGRELWKLIFRTDLSIAVIASPEEPRPGDEIAYAVTTTNLGPSDSTDVVLTAVLPAGATFASATAGCAEADGTVTCNLGDLDVGGDVDVDIVVAAPVDDTMLTLSVSVTGDLEDPVPGNNLMSAETRVASASAAPANTGGSGGGSVGLPALLCWLLAVCARGARGVRGMRRDIASVAMLVCCWVIAGCGSSAGGSSPSPPPTPAGPSTPPAASFSDYFPLSKGVSRDYQVSGPEADSTDVTHTWTDGLTYGDQPSVRTCVSPLEWEDQAHVGGQTLSFAFSDEAGTIGTFDQPVILGQDDWEAGQTVISNVFVSHDSGSYPIHLALTYVGLEPLAVPAGTFDDAMRVDFSLNYGTVTGTSWYARGIGLAKRVDSDGEFWELSASDPLPSPAPELLGVSQPAGATEGGNLITLAGSGVQQGATVTIGNKICSSILVEGPESASTFIPPGPLGDTAIVMVNPDCQVALIEDQFEYRDVWTATSTTGAPEERSDHTAVWTGSEMIVWGGQENGGTIDGGGRFDPVSNTWRPMSTVGAPEARWAHTAVWTGTKMIVWGGKAGGYDRPVLGSGAAYDPQSDTWTPVSQTGAPSHRHAHTAVWTGDEMIVWGGSPCTSCSVPALADGARYDPATDTWAPVQATGAPDGRGYHSAVWTGDTMIVWGGDDDNVLKDSGGIYSPASDSWAATSLAGAPAHRRCHGATWTGSAMVVIGGQTQTGSGCETLWNISNTGGRYYPETDTWEAVSPAPEGLASDFSPHVWTGTEIIMQGANGCQYDPLNDTWLPVWTTNASEGGTAVWTGAAMIIWGGEDSRSKSDRGGIYEAAVDPMLLPEPLPSIADIDPNEGPVAGGTDITIAGSHFRPDAGVSIGGQDATNVQVVDGETIVAITPVGDPGYADVVVHLADVPWWTVTAGGGFTYTPFSFEGWIGGGRNGWQIGVAPEYGGSDDAEFASTSGIFVDADGSIFVADGGNNRVQKWSANGDYGGWIGGGLEGWQTGAAPLPEADYEETGDGQFRSPHRLCVDGSGHIYIADTYNDRIQKWEGTGKVLGWIGGGVDRWQTGMAPSPGTGDRQFDKPMGIALDNAGNIYIADKDNHRVQKWTDNGLHAGWIGGGLDGWHSGAAPAPGSDSGSFQWPMDVAVDATGNIYVADAWNWRIQKFDSAGSFIGWVEFGSTEWQSGAASASGTTIYGVSVDPAGNILAALTDGHFIAKWDSFGDTVGWIGNGQYGWQIGDVTDTGGEALGYFEHPVDMMVGPDGKLYIADTGNSRVQKWTPSPGT